MIEEFFKQRSTVARLQSGPMAQQLPSIAEALHREQYPPETIRRYVRVADGLGRWLSEHGLSLAETDETILARYRTRTGRRHDGRLRAAGRGLAKLLALLRVQDAVGKPVRSADSEGDRLAAAFDSHLQHVAGLMPRTRSQYLRWARLFVKATADAESFDIAKVTPQAITDFVCAEAAKLKPSACAAPVTGMRVFLRFLATSRGLPTGVIGAVPTIRQWKLASLPKHLSAEEVDRCLATCDEQSPAGKRDRVILLLLLRLALRAGEVARLRLSDIDWREGAVRIYSAKSARERTLPLPSDVGQALAEYLRDSRPTSAQPYVFLRTRAPFSPITGCSTVSCIVAGHQKT